MKSFFYFIAVILMLSGCATETSEPISEKKGPQIPIMAQAALTDKEALPAVDLTENPQAMDRLIDRIDQNLTQQNITQAEIRQGYYYAEEKARKWGTPPSWTLFEHDGKWYWMSSDQQRAFQRSDAAEICSQTGGTYLLSCIETESDDCEYVPENTCECAEGSGWLEEQGCLALDAKGEWQEISAEELEQGWYKGGISEKKFNTPFNWIWTEDGEEGKWKIK